MALSPEKAARHAAHSRAYYYKNREAVRAREAARRAAMGSEERAKKSAYDAKYYIGRRGTAEHKAITSRAYAKYRLKNSAKRAAQVQSWRARNPERKRENGRRWAVENKARVNELLRKRRLLLASIRASGISETDWLSVVEEFNGCCAYCLKPANTMDHLHPISRGGGEERGNVVPACKSCNSSKRDLTLLELLMRPNRLVTRRMLTWHETRH